MQPADRPFTSTPAFFALAVVLVVGAALAGYLLGGGSASDQGRQAPVADGPTKALQASLPTGVYRDCKPTSMTAGQIAALTCGSVVSGADELRVTRYADATTMQREFAATIQPRYADGKCGTFRGGEQAGGTGRRSTWGARNARLACYVDDAPDALLLWQYDDQATQVVAVRRDADSAALFGWWQGTTRTPLT